MKTNRETHLNVNVKVEVYCLGKPLLSSLMVLFGSSERAADLVNFHSSTSRNVCCLLLSYAIISFRHDDSFTAYGHDMAERCNNRTQLIPYFRKDSYHQMNMMYLVEYHL